VKYNEKTNRFVGVGFVKLGSLPMIKGQLRNQQDSQLSGALNTGRNSRDMQETFRSNKSNTSSVKAREDPFKRRQRDIAMLHHR
jgi:hypothetical protein